MKGFSIRELHKNEVVGITLLDKYLNYDIADGLKSQLKDVIAEWQGRGCRQEHRESDCGMHAVFLRFKNKEQTVGRP